MTSAGLGYDPNAKPDTEAVAHTPDPTKYHAPDPRQGARGTMIPRGTAGGGSSGFKPDAGGIINVINTDLISLGGNPLISQVDIGKITKQQVKGVVKQASSMEDAWQRLGAPATTAERAIPELLPQAIEIEPAGGNPRQDLNPHKQGYVVPPSSVGGAQLPYDATSSVPAVLSLPQRPGTQGVPVTSPVIPAIRPEAQQQLLPPVTLAPPPQPAPPPTYTPPPAYPPPTGGPDPTTLAVLQQLVGGLNNLGALIQQQQAATPVQPPRAAPPEADSPPESPADPFESLQLPFFTPRPSKPTKMVYFEMGRGGRGSCRFHGYLVTDSLVLLLRDDRWDSGNEWLPQEQEEPMKITIAELNKSYNVYWSNCMFALGVIEAALFVIAKPASNEETEVEAAHNEHVRNHPDLLPQGPRQ